MDNDDRFFEAVIQARAAEEQCRSVPLESRAGDMHSATAERPLVVERKSPEIAREASVDFQELCRKSRQFEASKLSSRAGRSASGRDRNEP